MFTETRIPMDPPDFDLCFCDFLVKCTINFLCFFPGSFVRANCVRHVLPLTLPWPRLDAKSNWTPIYTVQRNGPVLQSQEDHHFVSRTSLITSSEIPHGLVHVCRNTTWATKLRALPPLPVEAATVIAALPWCLQTIFSVNLALNLATQRVMSRNLS